MAKLVLTIDNTKAIEGVQELKAEVQSLSKSLSSIKITSSGVETTRKGYANLITTLKTLKSQYADGVFGNLPQDAERAFKKIQEISAAFQESGKLTKEQAKAYAQLSQQLKKYTADLATVKAKNDKIVAANPFTVTQAQQIPRLIKQYSTLLTTLRNTEKYYPKGTFDTFKADLTQGQQELQALNNEFLTTGTLSQDSQVKLNNLANGYNQLNASIAQTTSTMKSSKGGLLDIISGFAKFQLSAMLVMKPLQMIRSALTSINETLVKTEDAVIALQRVLPTGSATDSEISSRLYKVAQDYGQTFENVSQIATNFARTGMSWADTIKATEAAVLALNVAELDAEEATTGLIAILSQFNLEASDLETVIDKLNKTADNFPVTTEKILAALQRTGSAASNANLSLDQTISLITALSKATGRSGENIGTALNSLIQYSSKASALDTFAALSDDSAAVVERFRQGGANILDVWRQVSKEIQNLKADQADLLDQYFATEDGEALKDALDGELQDIYTELGGVYDTANTFRKNYFIALLGNMDTVEQAMGTLGDAAGYSQAENEKYLDTYTAKLNSLKAQWQDIANDEQGLLGIKKELVDVASVLLSIIQWTGGLRTVLLAISTVVWMLAGDKIIAGIKSIGTAIKGLVTGFQSAKTAAQAFLGTLGFIATAVSFVVGIVQQANEKARQARLEAIENYQSNKENADQLQEIKIRYEELLGIINRTEGQNEELRTVEESLIKILGEKAKVLGLLTEGTEEYTSALKNLTEEEIKRNNRSLVEAQQGAEQELAGAKIKNSDFDYLFIDPTGGKQTKAVLAIHDALETAGFDVRGQSAYGMSAKKTAEGQLQNYLNVKKALEAIEKEIAQRTVNGDLETAERIQETRIYKDLIQLLNENEKKVNTYIETSAERYFNLLQESFGKGYFDVDFTEEEYSKLLEGVIERTNGGNLISDQLKEQIDLIIKARRGTEEVADETEDWHNNIAKVTGAYDDLIAVLEELRDAEKESLDLEEKKKAVLDAQADLKERENDLLKRQNELIQAQQALESARNEATVRRFNEATGQWEWQIDEKKVAEAQENVSKAEEDVEKAQKDILEAQEKIQDSIRDLEKQAYDTIIGALENKTATNDGLNALLDGLKEYLGDDFIAGIKNAILGATNVDLNKPINEGSGEDSREEYLLKKLREAGYFEKHNVSEALLLSHLRGLGGASDEEVLKYLEALLNEENIPYDSGGAAIGKGLMLKATDRPETVNNPDLTAKILSPVSNEQFHRYVHDMGLLFETARQYAQAPVIERVGGNTDNRVDNRGQIIFGGGLTVGADKRGASIDEVLALGGIVPNV